MAAAASAFRGILIQPRSKTRASTAVQTIDTARNDLAWKQPLPPQWHCGRGQEAGSIPHPPRAQGGGTSLAVSSLDGREQHRPARRALRPAGDALYIKDKYYLDEATSLFSGVICRVEFLVRKITKN